ncbi:isoprenylcysteine carboxylmethyltransferase family protein [Luteolibacter yonseiensis]|uniref:Isoprenylcysteine carboxylmethyltransferase family protein n=1 Tax=Luteolibacter yonseiensis TaxID=1144680 RepID=A0A934V801_9BACT|nr:isoprenylcysteine carboxylmethyltransferase family protein [Luteolibacter yonseiensis]MBK1816712.1 isoprenylcysteine carboxylmethyltransferase family protein [Luteolibacter yonseiensis]
MTPPSTTETDFYKAPALPAAPTETTRRSSGKDAVERLRKPLSHVVAATLIFLLVFVHPRGFGTLAMEGVKLAGLFLVFAGALGRILCTLYIGGRKNRELCQSGIYSMCRNPLYFFSFLGLTGVCLASQNLTLTLVATSLFLALYRAVILSEEKKLLRLFPSDFPVYAKSTPRFWPRSLPLGDSQLIQIDTSVFIRSLKEVLWFMVAVVGVEALDILRTHGMIHPLLSWY